ncbi:hypothetical protein [Gracilibacillus sp. YIM 98692]|uniref:hypothetical protein n=1 Tax=Gracilibacillus sp. YIM 98692 TaxID=2663532 RepID=UPI0013D0D140|nr:hypothetical protein [Gracilibacillus sp. YIM 98692]
MKKISILIIILVFGLGLFIYLSLQPNDWVGKSKDGKWTAIYEQEGIKDRWFGTLQWSGEGEPIITYREFKINGVHSAGDGQPGSEKQTRSEKVESEIEFAAFGEQPDNSDTLELILHWTEGDTKFEEVIVLQP